MSTPCEGSGLADPQKVMMPHSDLVDVTNTLQTGLSPLNTVNHASLLSTLPPPPLSPPLPLRSPLRPPARSISFQHLGGSSRSSRATQDSLETPPSSAIEDSTIIVDSNTPPNSFRMQDRNSFPTIDELLQAVNAVAADNMFSKSLTARPASPISLGLVDPPPTESSRSSSSLPGQVPPQSAMTKRQHALHELLSSERAYASDLALIREVHIPLALGQTVPLQNVPASPPASSASSSRTLSTASDSSTASLGQPMTQEDARIIFTNITELAVFSDMFCDELELALGALVDGGVGEDFVGELFCRIISELERPYQFYITRHPAALQHLQNLPQTPALQAYLSYTRNVAASVSHAWDLASLLIKPVQRLLKYPLLLAAIIDETPDGHPDKENLKEARARMEDVARNVNEVRRRAEVVKDVLTSKKKPVNVTVAASVNLSKMKNLRIKNHQVDENSEAGQVERMSQELKRVELFAQQFAKNIVEWARSMSKLVGALRTWSIGFGKVIGLSDDQGSEAFEAFLAVVEQQLMPLCVDLEAIINERLLKEIAHLLQTMNQPYKLLASMYEQEPFHYHLLNMNVSAKNRPPPALLAASTNYLALRGQLATDLPTYLALLHRGMAISVRRLADIQMRFWKDVKDRWGELWEMLRVDGELNAGHEETVNVWSARWLDVDEVLASLNINQAKKIYEEPERARPPVLSVQSFIPGLETIPSLHGKRSTANSTTNILAALEPSYVPNHHVSAPYPLAPSVRSRGRTDDVPPRRPSRRNSNENMYTTNRTTKGKSPSRKGDYYDHAEYAYAEAYTQQQQQSYPQIQNNSAKLPNSAPAIPRRKSMPLSPDLLPTPARRATSPSRAATYGPDENLFASAYSNHPYAVASPRDSYSSDRSNPTGRVSRSTSRKRKPADTKENGNGNGKQRPSNSRNRSSSITSFFKVERDRERGGSPPPNMPEPDPRYMSNAPQDSWASKPAKYVCQVIHPCQPPAAVTYFSFPFFTLVNGDLYEVLQETGHPSIHTKLPLYVDDGEDCLLLCRDGRGNVGWALASFLEPINLTRRR